MLEREERKPKKSSVLSNMLEKRVEQDSKENPREKNPGAYKRYRGGNESIRTKSMSYYLSDLVISSISLKSLKEGVSKSEVVSRALELYLEEEMEEVKVLKADR